METTNAHTPKKWFKLLLVLWPIAALINLLLPFLIPAIINRLMVKATGIHGSLKRVNLSLIPGKCQVHQFNMDFLSPDGLLISTNVEHTTVQIEPLALWRGIISGYINIETPELHFVRITEAEKEERKNWGPITLDLPIIIKQLKVSELKLAYTDINTEPKVELETHTIDVEAINITNVAKGEVLPSEIEINGNIYGGLLKGKIKADFTSPIPAFDIDMSLEDMNLVMLNDFFAAYGKFTINKGMLNAYAEIAAENSRFSGYVKPLIQKLDIIGKQGSEQTAARMLWEGLLGATAMVFTNPKKEQLGTKVPFEGEFKDPKIKTWFAILETLRNAFIKALQPSLDYQITIDTVEE